MAFEQRPENLDAPDDAHQIDADRPVPARVIPFAIAAPAADAGIVDEDMDLAIARGGGIGGGLQLRLQRHIGDDARDIGIARLQRGNGGIERVLFDIAQHHLDPGLRQRRGDAEPDARCGTGDECGLAGEIVHVMLRNLFRPTMRRHRRGCNACPGRCASL